MQVSWNLATFAGIEMISDETRSIGDRAKQLYEQYLREKLEGSYRD